MTREEVQHYALRLLKDKRGGATNTAHFLAKLPPVALRLGESG